MRYTAKTLKGLEQVLEKELLELGATKTEVGTRVVFFEGDLEMLYKVNYQSRLALSVLVPLMDFSIETQDDLYSKIAAFQWEKVFSVDSKMLIDSFCMNSVYTHTQFLAQRAKDAICDRFRNLFNKRPYIDFDFPDFRIDVYLYNNHCIVSLNSSGDHLFKRNYRIVTNEAPINEVLAAGMIALSGWDGETDFLDPMCGSGTLLIEATMKACKIPAQFWRSNFSFKKWYDYDPIIWKEVRDKANSEMIDMECNVFGYDISHRTTLMAQDTVKHVRLHKDINIKQGDFFEMPAPSEKGTIICNPPYGVRLNEEVDMNEFYKEIGDKLKSDYHGWDAWFISSNEEALKTFGLHPSKKFNLANGSLECKYQKFEMYEGSKKKSKEKKEE
ncbi:RNA methyltransferase [Bacteroidia bacterium]|nr:RNA methyltransferase [Bacteroidia bacterium]